uniref:Zf-an1 domain-containing protein n=1 Tax=Melanopsichium pennsylvanicum 4 TaxID=1398559 RepID=A0A077QXL5_9BASI|nr:zf-an1 domain-containing protein [Melanopsichium pennsylvanicum 4]
MPERTTGPMMFIGERCALQECHREDFLPFKCSDCRQHYCSNHFRPQAHRCSHYQENDLDYRVPLCPICDNPPQGWKRDQDPNIAMDHHLNGQCPMLDSNGHLSPDATTSISDSTKRVKKTNECSFVKCSKIMVVPIKCPQCLACFCPSHRAPNQHICKDSSSSSSSPASSITNTGIRNAFSNLKISIPSTNSSSNQSAPPSKHTPASARQADTLHSSVPFVKMFDKSEKWVPTPIFGKA